MTRGASAEVAIHDDRALPALTGIRFLAAFAVLLSHYDRLDIIAVPASITGFLDEGRTAVSLFFVLSGFVLAYNYSRLSGLPSVVRFWLARFARLWPGALLGLILGTVATVMILARDDAQLAGETGLGGQRSPLTLAVAWLSQITMTSSWFPFGPIHGPFNGPAWSIACEVLFYALFPLLIVWLRRMTLRSAVTVAVVAWVAQGLWILIVPSLFGQYGSYVIEAWPPTHVPEFVAGVVAGLWFMGGGRDRLLKNSNARVGLLLVSIGAMVAVSAVQPIQPVYYLMIPPVTGLLVALATPRRPFLRHPQLLVLGEASYALYITHLPIGYLLLLAGVGTVVGWVATIGMVGLSVVIWRFYETPLRLAIVRVGRERSSLNAASRSESR